jgi:hypothetical protein
MFHRCVSWALLDRAEKHKRKYLVMAKQVFRLAGERRPESHSRRRGSTQDRSDHPPYARYWPADIRGLEPVVELMTDVLPSGVKVHTWFCFRLIQHRAKAQNCV